MKKIVTVILLLLIAGSFFYCLFYFSFNLTLKNNIINNSFRKEFISRHFLRRAFRLNQIGDSRFDYAKDGEFKRLEITVHHKSNKSLSDDTIPEVVGQIKNVISKPEDIIVKDIILDNQVKDDVDDRDLRNIVKLYPVEWSYFSKSAKVQIFVLGRYYPHPTFSGLVIDGENIFLFMDAIKNEARFQNTSKDAEISTILHEFAHLLGAEHIEDKSCILSEEIENLSYDFPVINTSYCPLDLDEIKMRLSY